MDTRGTADGPQRRQILDRLGLLSPETEPEFDRLARLAARSVRCPIALVSFLCHEHEWHKGRFGWDQPSLPLAEGLCTCGLDDPRLVEVPDTLLDERTRGSAPVEGPMAVRFYAGQPIVFEGLVIGSVCVLDVSPRRLDPDDRATLADLAALAARILHARDRVAALELERRSAAALRAAEAKAAFLSRASHELRTPLNAILGFAQLALLDVEQLPPSLELRIEGIRVAGEKLLMLVNDILDLSRLEYGALRLAPQPLQAHACAGEVLLLLQANAHAAGVTLANELPQDVQVLADPGSLHQVLANVVSNAVKYNRRGGSVRVRLGPPADPAAHALVVEDTGPGMTPEQLDRLFQPFDRLGAETSAVPGTGLGLVIARSLMQAMGGALEVSTRPGCGTRVVLRLPHAGEARPSAVAASPVAAPARKVLYVEDDPVNRVLIEQLFLREPAWQLRTVETAAEALRAAADWRPDLVMLDMQLRDGDGMSLYQRLKEEGLVRPGACVAVSADVMPESIARATAAGIVEYWTKPLDLSAMWAALRRLLANPGS